jgi:hypothetical protein
MTHIDPRDPRRADIDPLTPDGRRPDLDPTMPANDPRLDRASGNSWAVVGGLAAALVLVIVLMSMFGGPSDQTATSPDTQRPPIAQGSPAGAPQPDPTTTGSVPQRQQPAPTPAPVQPSPAPAPQTAPPATPPGQQP